MRLGMCGRVRGGFGNGERRARELAEFFFVRDFFGIDNCCDFKGLPQWKGSVTHHARGT